jgi:sugar phosphate isomerase/epimerase
MIISFEYYQAVSLITEDLGMRLGGSVFAKDNSPEGWVEALKHCGFTAAFWPFEKRMDESITNAFVKAAESNDILIAEVGVWNNPLSSDKETKRAAIKACQEMLAVADSIGARCCVNIAGSRGEQWDGPHPENFSEDTFDMIVDTVRTIIDAVKPVNTFYTLEPMPWVFPESPDSYLRLIKAIDREHFAVHLDPVNMIANPRLYYNNGAFIRECFEKLGPYIKSCHAKDILLSGVLTVHLDEVIAGLGALDYRAYLTELNKLDADMPLMLEHLHTEEEFLQAAAYVRSAAENTGFAFK